MSDYACIYCEDRGDCERCSPIFESDKIHAACGRRWGDHVHHSQGLSRNVYPGWYTCPPDVETAPA